MVILLLMFQLQWTVSTHFLNASLYPWPSPVRNYSMESTKSDIVYEMDDGDCLCKTDPLSTHCYGQDCLEVPRNVTIHNRSLKITGTGITTLSQDDFAGYEHLLDLQLDGNEIANISDGTFQNLNQLINLSISFNDLASISAHVFSGLESLRVLRLTKNQFSSLSNVIPSLSQLPQLQTLILSENTLGRIDASDFEPLTNSSIETLQLTNCDLKYIHSEALLPLKSLKRLQLSENTMPDDNLVHLLYVLKQSELQILDLSHMFSGMLPRMMLDVLSRSNVIELVLQMNTLPRLKTNTFPFMPNIQSLDLSKCGIISIDNGSFGELPNLKRLVLASNTLLAIPSAVMLPQLQHLSLSDNSGGGSVGGELALLNGSFHAMSNLTLLDLSSNRIGQISKDAFTGLSRLEQLYLTNASLYRLAEGCFKPLSSLKILHLEGNHLNRQNLSRALFQGLVHLEYLNLDSCKITAFNQEGIFSSSPRLHTLSLRRNFIQSFNKNPFVDAASLVTVDLTDNQIREWNTSLFTTSSRMQHLNLAGNQISSVTDAMMKDFIHLLEVDLLENPLDCDCQLRPFKVYAVQHEDTNDSQLLIKAGSCSSPDEWRFNSVIDFLLSLQDQDCQIVLDGQPDLMPLYVVIVLILLVTAVAFALYRGRWLIRYYIFRKQLEESVLKETRPGDGQYNYDAFVSYSNEDHNFVLRLVMMLENQSPHYKLCVYERDFTAGTVLNDCIIQSIANSRKVVLIISEHFIHSQWCLWELHLAQHSLLEDKRDGIILIVVGKLKLSQLPPTLRFLMKTRIYLEWHHDPGKQQLFWLRLRNALSPANKIGVDSSTAIEED